MLIFFQDHDCTGKSTRQVSDAGRAALARQQNQASQGIAKYFTRQPQPQQPRSRPNANQIQGNLSEDEALAQALAASMNESATQASTSAQAPTTQEEQDRMLAMALAQSEQEARRQQGTTASGNNDKSCQIS